MTEKSGYCKDNVHRQKGNYQNVDQVKNEIPGSIWDEGRGIFQFSCNIRDQVIKTGVKWRNGMGIQNNDAKGANIKISFAGPT